MVVADGVRTMTWGFPLVLKGKRTGAPLKPKPVNNARTDKLDGPFWRTSFRDRRCLIPASAWAEAEGPRGGKTRTWLSLPGQDPFAIAGLWRESAEWGPVYVMIMTEACGAAAECHDRMPVILPREAWGDWRSMSAPAAKSLFVPWTGELTVERTAVPWGG
jgi:putative SOS response-associated peptidase YedK